MTKGRAYLLILLFLGAFWPGLLIIPCPAFLSSCTKIEPLEAAELAVSTRIDIVCDKPQAKSSFPANIISLDVFVFNADGNMGLDSYERFDDYNLGAYCSATSSSGRKHIVLIANCPAEKLKFSNFSSYEDLKEFMFELDDDNSYCPLMYGEADFNAGKDGSRTVKLKQLLCEIVIAEISSSEQFNSISVCLRNLNTRAAVLENSTLTSYSIDEQGQEFPYRAGLTLYCYPYASDGGLGAPHTEINIVCRTGGDVREYSIVVNNGNGIERNSRYVYTINIK